MRELDLVVGATGQPLGVEDVLLDSRRGESVDVPVVTTSTTLVESAYVEAVGDRPT